MRALITGAGGFAGRHLARHLLDLGWDVIGLASRTSSAQLPDEVTVLGGNLLDADLTNRTIAHYRPDVIFHLAAQSYVPQALINPSETLVNNTLAELNVLDACRLADLNPVVVVASSAEVYGAIAPEHLPATEETPFRPANPYAVSKVTQDMLGLQYFLSYGLNVVRARPFNHVGPGQPDRFVVSSFARQIAEVEIGRADPVMLVGNLEARRDFLDVRDVVRAYAMMAQVAFAGEVFNVASGAARRIGDILDELLRQARVAIRVEVDPARMRPSDVPLVVGDRSRLTQATGWTPEIPFEQTLAEVLDDWRGRVRGRG